MEKLTTLPPSRSLLAAWRSVLNVPFVMIFGPIYYRRLVRHQKLDERFGNELVDHIISYVKS